jgi:hypothetical protein
MRHSFPERRGVNASNLEQEKRIWFCSVTCERWVFVFDTIGLSEITCFTPRF